MGAPTGIADALNNPRLTRIEDFNDFADQFLLIMEGAIVTEAINRNNKAAQTAARLARTLIDSYRAAKR